MRKHLGTSWFGVFVLVWSALPASAQTHGAQVSGAIEHDVSLPLANMPPLQPKGGPRTKPLFLTHPGQPSPNQPDPVVQTSIGSLATDHPRAWLCRCRQWRLRICAECGAA